MSRYPNDPPPRNRRGRLASPSGPAPWSIEARATADTAVGLLARPDLELDERQAAHLLAGVGAAALIEGVLTERIRRPSYLPPTCPIPGPVLVPIEWLVGCTGGKTWHCARTDGGLVAFHGDPMAWGGLLVALVQGLAEGRALPTRRWETGGYAAVAMAAPGRRGEA